MVMDSECVRFISDEQTSWTSMYVRPVVYQLERSSHKDNPAPQKERISHGRRYFGVLGYRH